MGDGSGVGVDTCQFASGELAHMSVVDKAEECYAYATVHRVVVHQRRWVHGAFFFWSYGCFVVFLFAAEDVRSGRV